MIRIQTNIQKALELLQIDTTVFSQLKTSLELKQTIKAIKKEAKKNFRELAKKHHPDLDGDHNLMIKYIEAIKLIKTMKVQVIEPRPVYRRIFARFVYPTHTYAQTTNSTTTSDSSFTWTGF